jgi:hypothetical protein
LAQRTGRRVRDLWHLPDNRCSLVDLGVARRAMFQAPDKLKAYHEAQTGSEWT